uniref:MORC family CW-type zinc finger protein 1 isoform X2 n=1 Tax=Macaca mulatta TaxID=9544 RepID=UPI0010A22ED0|nr:MORC family CW-type zinc finger protein 1 isoform X2 [Macaca mulatta]
MDDRYAALRRAQLHLDFIHANSTTHSFLFGALAELLDNARDAGAERLDVFSVDNENLQGGFMLCFLDDGCGMSPEEASDIIYFGRSKKRLSTLKFIGQYGNGLKSGSMRIGKDFILFTKKEETMTCVFFSQTFCEEESLSEVVVPMPSWLIRTRESVTDDPQKFAMELSIIYKYSPFKTEAELMQQFDVIYGKCGTLLVIYNLKLLLNGEPELDVKTDKEDILMAGALEDFPARWSFRAYTSILYFNPWMRIFIQAKRVKTKHLCYCLYRPRKYLYVTSSFKGAFKNEVKKAEEAVKIAEFILKEAQIKVNQCDRTSLSSAKDVLQRALEDVEAKQKNLKEKQRELKKARTLSLFYGVNVENRSQAGMFIYSNNRLIKMHEKVGSQLKLKSLLGAGVVGIVNIPLEVMEPSHNKQEFLNVQEYNHLLKVMGQYLVQYCKDTGIISKISERDYQENEYNNFAKDTHRVRRQILKDNRNLTLFCNEFGYQNDIDMEKPLNSIQYQRRQAMGIPFIIQCDLCLKWRVLPSSTDYQEKEFFDIWICANNPNRLENSCHQVERLPSIPLGTMSTISPSKNEKEKQLRESVLKYQNRLAEQQPQPQFIPVDEITVTSTCLTSANKENTKTQKIRLLGDDLKHESLSSFELSVSHRGQKRNIEETDSDVEYISETKIMKKSMEEKMNSQQQRPPVALPENVTLAERSQKSQIANITSVWRAQPTEEALKDAQAAFWEMKKKQSLNFVEECKVLIEDDNSKSDSDIILVSDKSNTDASLKQEKKEIPLINQEKQELCNDVLAMKRSSSLPSWKSLLNVPMEDVNLSSGRKDRVCVSGSDKVASLPASSQSTPVKETVRKLKSKLREILLYFFPEYQLPSELEEPALSCEIQNTYMVQYEKKIKRKLQSVIYDSNTRGIHNEISVGQCENKRKISEDKLKNLRIKLALLLQKLQLGGPEGDLEQIDTYLEALLKEDNRLLQNNLNKVTIDTRHRLPLEKK